MRQCDLRQCDNAMCDNASVYVRCCCKSRKGRNFHNRRQAKRSLRTATNLRLAHGAQASFGAQITPVRTAKRYQHFVPSKAI
jgi:hypothetical protein